MALLKNSWLGKIIFFLTLFLFVYPFKMVGLPVSFRVLFSAFGVVIFGIRLLALRKVYFSSQILFLFLSALSICAISVISVYVVNHSGDPEFVNFWLLPLLCLFSGYFVVAAGMAVLPKLNFFVLSKYFIVVVLAQAFLSAAMFVNPSIYKVVLSIQQMDELDMMKSEMSIGSRLLGLGASFMIMGVINCVAMLLAVILLKHEKSTTLNRTLLIISYLAIFVVGMMQSRTTLLGLVVSLAYLLFSSFRFRAAGMVRSSKHVGRILFVSALLVGIVLFFAGDFIRKNQQIIEYGFELVANYQKTGKFESSSTNDLESMYVLPTHIKTYLIGDGRFNTVAGIAKYGYYMNIDVGFIRLIYYFGIPGLILFSIYQFLLVKYSFTLALSDYRFIIFYFFLFVILWNLKSVMDTNILLTPFCVLNIIQARKKVSENPELHDQLVLQHA